MHKSKGVIFALNLSLLFLSNAVSSLSIKSNGWTLFLLFNNTNIYCLSSQALLDQYPGRVEVPVRATLCDRIIYSVRPQMDFKGYTGCYSTPLHPARNVTFTR